jgi:RNA polymerase sigma-70 factor (family 1)
MDQLANEMLIEFNQGNPQAFQAIYNAFDKRIFYFVKNLIDDRLQAEEITSDTFIKLYRLRDRFNSYNNIQAFLFITARNASLDYLRWRNRQRQYMDVLKNEEKQDIEVPSFSEIEIETGVLQFIYNEIEKLPPQCRLIFKLSYFDDLSVAEIAEKMKLHPQTVSNQKQNALKFLRLKVLDRTGILLSLLCFLGLCESR